MTPPPPEPIRPVGGVTDGGFFVDRAAAAQRLQQRRRRRPRGEQDEPQQHGGRDPDQDPTPQPRAFGLSDPGAYDDHGRRMADEAPNDLGPHVDATA
jgi:hypothetical protein